jgi:hypothetical protein
MVMAARSGGQPTLFNQVPRDVLVALASGRFQGAELAVMLAIAVRVYAWGPEKGTVAKALTFDQLAQGFHLTRRSAMRAVRSLEDAHVISVERGERQGPRNPVNLYRIQPVQWWSAATRSPGDTRVTRPATGPDDTPVTPPDDTRVTLRNKTTNKRNNTSLPTPIEQPRNAADGPGGPGSSKSSNGQGKQRHDGRRGETSGHGGAGQTISKGAVLADDPFVKEAKAAGSRIGRAAS